MILLDVLTQVFEKHNLDISEEIAQAIASDVDAALDEQERYSIWSLEAKEHLQSSLHYLKSMKAMANNELDRTELGVLIYKIEELLIKN